MRDAILAADDINNDVANHYYIWTAFAKRGLGYSAEQGSSDDLTDGKAAYDLPPYLDPQLAINMTATPNPVKDGGELTYVISVRNDTEGAVSAVRIKDSIPAQTSFVSATDGRFSKGVVTFKPVKMEEGEIIERSFTVKVNTGSGTTILFNDDMENKGENWKTFHDVGLEDWKLSTKNPHSGTTSWFAVDPDAFSNQSLILRSPVQIKENSLLRFWHDYATEDSFDGGVVEISTNGGLSWEDLGSKMIQNGYNGEIPVTNASTVQGPVFTGSSDGYVQTIVDLNSYTGQSVLIRFRMGSDVLTPATGWYVDEVDIVINPTYITNTAWVDSKYGGLTSVILETLVVEDEVSSTESLGLNAEAKTLTLTEELENLVEEDVRVTLSPNPAAGRVQLHFREQVTGPVQVIISSTTGQQLLTQSFSTAGDNVLDLDLSKLGNGTYLVNIHTAAFSASKKVIVSN